MIEFVTIDIIAKDESLLDTVVIPAIYAADFSSRILAHSNVQRLVMAKSDTTVTLADVKSSKTGK